MKLTRVALNVWVGLHFVVAIANMIIGAYLHALLMIILAVVVYYVIGEWVDRWDK